MTESLNNTQNCARTCGSPGVLQQAGATAVVPRGGRRRVKRSVLALVCLKVVSPGQVEVKPWRGRGEGIAAEVGKATAKVQKGVARLGQPK